MGGGKVTCPRSHSQLNNSTRTRIYVAQLLIQYSSIFLHLTMKTVLERMMRLSRDKVNNLTFCFNEEFYVFCFVLFQFSRAFTVYWLDSHHSSDRNTVLVFGSHAPLQPGRIQQQYHFYRQSGSQYRCLISPRVIVSSI